MKKLALLLSLVALGALGLVACEGDDDETTAPSDTGAALSQQEKIELALAPSNTGAATPQQEKIELAGNEWAPLFAGRERFCELMTQPACGRLSCKGIGSIENCKPPSLEFRKSFEDATVEDVAIAGDKAAARFSNGETIELEKVHSIPDPLLEDGDRFSWLIHKWFGGEVEGTRAASSRDSKSCGAYMRYRLAAVEGGTSCRMARRVVHRWVYQRVLDGWICAGGDRPVRCSSEAGGTIRAPVRKAVLRRWEAAEAS